MTSSIDDIKHKLLNIGQYHLLQFWNELDDESQSHLLKSLDEISLDKVNSLFENARNSLRKNVTRVQSLLKPLRNDQIEVAKDVKNNVLDEYNRVAFEAIVNNEVAVILLAGGQGTRLGVHYPKGMFSVDLPSGKCLYQIQAERIRRVLELARLKTGKQSSICWYIMTSESTNDLTLEYFEKHEFFGLNENDVVIFQQCVLPCFDLQGKIILNGKDNIALAPDGNGGLYKALHENGILEDMQRRGIKYVHCYGVDNILVKVADPSFLGYCIKRQADCGAKVIKKKNPSELVGVICMVDGHIKVVEYSEIDMDTACLRHDNGELVFSAGNICNHFFKTDFLLKVALNHELQMPLHVANKKIPFINKEGCFINPDAPNGIKIEKFVFDAFQFSENFVTWEVECDSEFSPLKNADSVGKDCPSTARRDILRLHKQYIEDAGGFVEEGKVEISPLLSYSGENLSHRVKDKTFGGNTVLWGSQERLNIVNGD